MVTSWHSCYDTPSGHFEGTRPFDPAPRADPEARLGYSLRKTIDTLTAVPVLRRDARLADLVAVATSQRAIDGYRVTTVSSAWSSFDFGRKRESSAWVTFLVLRAEHRSSMV